MTPESQSWCEIRVTCVGRGVQELIRLSKEWLFIKVLICLLNWPRENELFISLKVKSREGKYPVKYLTGTMCTYCLI